MTHSIITTGYPFSATALFLITMPYKEWRADPFEPCTKAVYLIEEPQEEWHEYNLGMSVSTVARYRYPNTDRQVMAALSPDGFVGFYGKGECRYEKIPGAGLFAEDSKGWGSVERIRQIGACLYVCGGGGQIYKREAADSWVHLDEALLEGTHSGPSLWFKDINGQHENDIYAAGWNGAIYWKGSGAFEALPCVTSSHLQSILIEDEGNVWISGAGHTLLRGNYRDGFAHVVPDDRSCGSETFLSMAKFQDQLYLASESSLYVFDGERISPIDTGLEPPMANWHILDVVDGVLWCIGYYDIARFDGSRWRRFHLPGNSVDS